MPHAQREREENIMLNLQTTVARTVLDHSECATVFQRHRIDYCCKGNMTLAAACEERGLAPAVVVADLERAISERSPTSGPHFQSLPTASLIAYVISTHHDYLRTVLPVVRGLATKVARVHGDHNPHLLELETVVGELAEALLPHLDDEEQVLFPAMMTRNPPKALIAAELAKMQTEHLAVGTLLDRMRTATENFLLPEWACTSYRALFKELEQVEGDVLRHVHLENHVLLPRFLTA